MGLRSTTLTIYTQQHWHGNEIFFVVSTQCVTINDLNVTLATQQEMIVIVIAKLNQDQQRIF